MQIDLDESTPNTTITVVGFNEAQVDHKNVPVPDHPESADRIVEIRKVLEESGLLEKCEVITSFPEADDTDLLLVHEKTMIEEIMGMESKTQEEIDVQCKKYDSVFATNKSVKATKQAAGCCEELTRKIISGEASNGIALVRPPGHHADREEPCGFCLFNNVAYAAETAFNLGADRILIVDLDIHHGQGTQRKFYDDKRILYFSIHRYEHGLYWPHLKESDFDNIGEGVGVGYNANLPLNETGCGDADYLAILWHVLLPLATQFDPNFVIISAGFDCLIGDPLGEMKLSPDGYSQIIYHLKMLAKGRLLMVLEGGYNHKMGALGVQRCLKVLLGYSPNRLKLKEKVKESTIASCLSLVSVLRNYWPCFTFWPTKSSLRFAEWPIINSSVVYKYDKNERTPDTGCILQNSLFSQDWREGDSSSEKRETLLFFNEGDDRHYAAFDPESDHPERPARTSSILAKLRSSRLMDECVERNCERIATDEEILMVHTEEMLDELKATQTMNDEALEAMGEELDSIYLTRDTLDVAQKTVGTVLQCIDEVFEKPAGIRNAAVITRPPGHHASSSKSSGFCIFNNVAIGAKYAQKKYGVKKVLILDWDVHHGNGTQEIFYNDPTVMYMSIHRHDKGVFYPMGEPKDFFDTGENDGEGFTVNIPFSGGDMGDLEYQAAFNKVIMPIAYEFDPDLVLISAGFDAARNDPLGSYKVSPETFAFMTYQLCGLASGRVISVLEGGYNLKAISESALAMTEVLVKRMMIRRIREEKEQHATVKATIKSESVKTLRDVCNKQRQYWVQLDGFQVLPTHLGLEIHEQEMGDNQPSSSNGTSIPQGLDGVHAVVPLTTCPHLGEVAPLPSAGIDASKSCNGCGIGAEVWLCLTCHEYNCGRFIHEHAMFHNLSSNHPMALSMADLSVWCYPCEAYVHNPLLIPAKSAAHESKFGEKIPS